MLSRDWLLVVAAGGFLAGLLAFGGCAVLCGEDGPDSQRNTAKSARAAQQEAEKPPPLPAGITIIGVETKKSSAEEREEKDAKEREEKRNIRDVSAQETMALAACAIVGLTIIQIVVGAVTIAFLYYTLDEAKRTANASVDAAGASNRAAIASELAVKAAQDSVIVAEKTAEKQLRAYLSLVPQGVLYHRGEGKLMIGVAQKNAGQTPAFDVRFFSVVEPLKFPLPPGYQFERGEPTPGVNVVHPGSEFVVPANFEVPLETIAQHAAAGDHVYFFGVLTYKDVFGTPHETMACWSYDLRLFDLLPGARQDRRGYSIMDVHFIYDENHNKAT